MIAPPRKARRTVTLRVQRAQEMCRGLRDTVRDPAREAPCSSTARWSMIVGRGPRPRGHARPAVRRGWCRPRARGTHAGDARADRRRGPRRGAARVLAVPTDVSDRDQVRSLVDQAVTRVRRIDVLVNAAFPPAPGGPVVDMDDDAMDAWRRSIDAGAYGTLLTCRFVAPHMIDAGAGAIVNVTSMTSRMAHGGRSDYAAGKAAMHRLGWALADELGPLGIRVNAVAPGAILGEGVRGWIEGNAAEERRHVRGAARRARPSTWHCGASPPRTRSPTRSSSSPPTSRPASPAPPSTSTPANSSASSVSAPQLCASHTVTAPKRSQRLRMLTPAVPGAP